MGSLGAAGPGGLPVASVDGGPPPPRGGGGGGGGQAQPLRALPSAVRAVAPAQGAAGLHLVDSHFGQAVLF